jgi:hypothetical protein
MYLAVVLVLVKLVSLYLVWRAWAWTRELSSSSSPSWAAASSTIGGGASAAAISPPVAYTPSQKRPHSNQIGKHRIKE